MKNKTFTSFEEIDNKLTILTIEKEISYQKLILASKNIFNIFTPKTISKNVINTFLGSLKNSKYSILKIALPILFKSYLNKKRSK